MYSYKCFWIDLNEKILLLGVGLGELKLKLFHLNKTLLKHFEMFTQFCLATLFLVY